MTIKRQLIFIHGGEVFESENEFLDALRSWEFQYPIEDKRRWNKRLEEFLPGFEIIAPRMPCKENANYEAWKIWFEKVLPLASCGTVFVGYSLGASFLIKFFSEYQMGKRYPVLFLVAPAFFKNSSFAMDDSKMSSISKIFKKVVIFHSADDFVVPFEDTVKIKELIPGSEILKFESRGHFLQEDFPELIEAIRHGI